MIVRADSAGQVPESSENNNDSASPSPCYIFLSPTPDLLVTAINVPAQAFSGQPVTLSWTVLNNGSATAQKWYDAVYLSFDQIFDRSADLYLGYVEHTGGLDVGSSYNVTHAFNIPANLHGAVYLFVVADSTDRVYERQAEANNIARSTACNVDLPPVSDLVVTSVNPPAGLVMVGETNTITYTVLNQSAATVKRALGRQRLSLSRPHLGHQRHPPRQGDRRPQSRPVGKLHRQSHLPDTGRPARQLLRHGPPGHPQLHPRIR